MGSSESPTGQAAPRPAAPTAPYEDHLGTSTHQRLEEGGGAKTESSAPARWSWNSLSGLWHRKTTVIAALSIVSILLYLVLRFGFHTTPDTYQIPLLVMLVLAGDMALSVIGMVFAVTGHLRPVSGAITQKVIDVRAVLNALRAASPPKVIHDL